MKVSRFRRRRRLSWIASGLAAAAIVVPSAVAMPIAGQPAPDAGAGVPAPQVQRDVTSSATRIHVTGGGRHAIIGQDAHAKVPDQHAIIVHRGSGARPDSGTVVQLPASPRTTAASSDDVDWTDAGVGAAIGLTLGFGLLTAATSLSRRRRALGAS
jgi:hypothetical protein